jgi:hypothetical protein
MTTERTLLDCLHRRLDAQAGVMAARHIVAEHVRSDPTWGGGIADAISVDTWGSGGYAVSGYEVKCSRSDWLRELRQPQKCEPWRRHCSRWWLVATKNVVRDDLPEGWGLLERRGDTLRRVVDAPLLDPLPLTPKHLAGLARAIQTTADRRTSRRIAAQIRRQFDVLNKPLDPDFAARILGQEPA